MKRNASTLLPSFLPSFCSPTNFNDNLELAAIFHFYGNGQHLLSTASVVCVKDVLGQFLYGLFNREFSEKLITNICKEDLAKTI
jgi:hypothetical protein